jgi:hypothetical protein
MHDQATPIKETSMFELAESSVISWVHPRWRSHRSTQPYWLTQALDLTLTPAQGRYSYVFPWNSNFVVKLVHEQGAQRFLRAAWAARGSVPGLPFVPALPVCDIRDAASGRAYSAFLIERLEPALDAGEYLAERYLAQWHAQDRRVPYAQRSRLAVAAMQRELSTGASMYREAAGALKVFGRELASSSRMAADLVIRDVWMRRPSDGRIVLCDPGHEDAVPRR